MTKLIGSAGVVSSAVVLPGQSSWNWSSNSMVGPTNTSKPSESCSQPSSPVVFFSLPSVRGSMRRMAMDDDRCGSSTTCESVATTDASRISAGNCVLSRSATSWRVRGGNRTSVTTSAPALACHESNSVFFLSDGAKQLNNDHDVRLEQLFRMSDTRQRRG